MAGQKWMNTINELRLRNPVMLSLNSVCSNSADANGLDIFPFMNFANHSQHGVDIEKYLKAWPEEEREKVRQRNQKRITKLVGAFRESKEVTLDSEEK
jgi:hypothetical protein